MDDTLKRLLAAEQKARDITSDAEAAADQTVQSAQADVRREYDRFRECLPEIRQSYFDKADERAQQAIGELERRHAEQVVVLREAAEVHEDEALDAAFGYLLNGKP